MSSWPHGKRQLSWMSSKHIGHWAPSSELDDSFEFWELFSLSDFCMF